MRAILLWLIETPARLIGGLIGGFWAVLALAVIIGFGWLVFQLCEDRFGRRPAQVLACVLGLYAGMVMWDAQKWTALALLEHYRGDMSDE